MKFREIKIGSKRDIELLDEAHISELKWSELLKEKQEDYEVYFNIGLAQYLQYKIDQAHSNFSKAIELNQEDYRSIHYRGRIKIERGEIEDAIEDFNKVILICPNHYEAYSFRGVANRTLGRLTEAIYDFQKAVSAIELPEIKSEQLLYLALAYYEVGEYNLAIKHCEEAIKFHPKNVHAKELLKTIC